ncbi:MAG: glycosyltransferase family 4 protein [Alphaproteobacteria bacterium]
MPSPMAPVAFVLKGYPRLSETFITQEILALELRGVPISIFSLRRPSDAKTHAMHRDIAAPVNYLPEYARHEPMRVLRSWFAARRLPGYSRAVRTWLRDLRRDPTTNRTRRFAQALVLASEMDGKIRHLHAHFLHTPGSVARYAAIMRELPWSFSAHAKDIWTTPVWELREKLADSAWGVSCTAAGTDYLNGLGGPGRHPAVKLVYHGLDLSRFPPPPPGNSNRDGRTQDSAVRLISVGRAVVKKGHDTLLRALALLPKELHWRLQHLGGGPELAALQELAQNLGLDRQISWSGPADQAAVIDALRDSDLFVLACRIGPDGDRDGIPNVLLEAQSQALAAVTSRLPAILEFIIDGETGLLCPPENAQAFAGAIGELIRDPERRAHMGRLGRARVEDHFQTQSTIDVLARLFNPDGGGTACA